MDASPALAGFRYAEFERLVLVRLARRLVWTLLGLIALAGVLVCVRRASGSLVQPLPPLALLALGIVLSAAALAFRQLPAVSGLRGAQRYAAWATASAVLLCWTLGVALSETSTPGLVLLIAPLVAIEGWSWGRVAGPGVASREGSLPWPGAGDALAPAIKLLDEPEDRLAAPVDESMSQSMQRRREEQGEIIEGWTRVAFLAEQRHAVAHVAICPPLDVVPQCYAEQADGPPAQLKVAQVLPHGVRFEIKLDEPAPEPTSVIIEFSVQEQ